MTLVEPARVASARSLHFHDGSAPGAPLSGRFQAVCLAASALAAVPYVWVLCDMWNGTLNPLRLHGTDDNPIYDVQARALMQGASVDS